MRVAWRNWGKRREISIRIVGVPVEIRTEYLPNIIRKYYQFSRPTRHIDMEFLIDIGHHVGTESFYCPPLLIQYIRSYRMEFLVEVL
jgi:hypothetical protein